MTAYELEKILSQIKIDEDGIIENKREIKNAIFRFNRIEERRILIKFMTDLNKGVNGRELEIYVDDYLKNKYNGN
jgi:2C-methyl-D-erythritol 2,4-cyclodiphosphate synthase